MMNKLFGKSRLNTDDRPEWAAMKPTKHDKQRWSRGGMLTYLAADKKVGGMNVVCLACREEFTDGKLGINHNCEQEGRFREVTGRVVGSVNRNRPRHYKKRVPPVADSVTEVDGVAEFVKGIREIVEQRDVLLEENQRLIKENEVMAEQTREIRAIMDVLRGS